MPDPAAPAGRRVGPPRDPETATLRRPSDLGGQGRAARRRGDGPWRTWPAGFASTAEDREALLVLLSLPSLTARRLLELAGAHPSASACLDAVGRGEAASDADRASARSLVPDEVVERLAAVGARLVTVHDPEYPPELLELYDPPAGVFVLGGPVSRSAARVAIVGSRNCSLAGRAMASDLARALARAGAWVVSGAARGIDASAHRGALEAGGSTVAVLGCGVDVAYPAQHRRLLRRIAQSGALVSEYPPGTRAEPFRFPARNRIVAGLSRAVVVVEGAAGSGSMITVDHALEAGRDVFAVPGPPSSELSTVPLALIREGATLIRGPDDLLADLGLSLPPPTTEAPVRGSPAAPELSGPERRVFAALDQPAPADRLADVTGLPFPEVMAALVALELRRLVVAVGGRYERRRGDGAP